MPVPVPVPPDEDANDSGSDEGSEPESYFPGAEVEDPEFEELSSDDFPTYFIERDGRLFHSHGGSPYPLPVDTPEQERMNLMGGHYPDSCPVSEVLAEDPERQKYALDLCTGTGKWTMDVAHNFPHVAFRGLDIVPIATRYPLPNVDFSMHDVNTPTVWSAGTFDFIHARSITMAVTSYPNLLAEISRLLRPRGSSSRASGAATPPSTPPTPPPARQQRTPRVRGFLRAPAGRACRARPAPRRPAIAPLLAHTGAFDEITTREYSMPIGPWHPDPAMKPMGRAMRAAFLRYMLAVRPMLAESGVATTEDLDDVYGRVRQEVRDVEGLHAVFHAVHARKI
ncbi:S-adenosyl-L-methionine-dependent methyltransferase [Mycena leptocephala]|nr:S-adenosyl-L-methionine-dependent methyltransferase [Mycena leptocephala]